MTSKLLEQDTSAEKLYIVNEYVTFLPGLSFSGGRHYDSSN